MEMSMIMSIINGMNTIEDLEDMLIKLEACREACIDSGNETNELSDIECLIEEVKEQIEFLYEIEEESAKRDDKYYSANRCELLVKRFFDIIEEGGEYNELFLIRDLLMDEYITYGGCTQVEIIQIDDIIEESVEMYIDLNNIVVDYEVETLEKEIFSALLNSDGSETDVYRIIELMNNYGDLANAHPYIYYTFVRELERITGETLIELCL